MEEWQTVVLLKLVDSARTASHEGRDHREDTADAKEKEGNDDDDEDEDEEDEEDDDDDKDAAG